MSSKLVPRGATVLSRPSLLALVLTFAALWSAAPSALAAPGDLDPTFSADGKLTTDFGFPGSQAALDIAVQPDGRIIAVGLGGTSGAPDFGLVRYNPDGSLDLSFSGDGGQGTDFGGDDVASAVAVQANGKIVAVGSGDPGSSSGDDNFALAR